VKKEEGGAVYFIPTTGSQYIDRFTWANMQIAKRIMVFCTMDIISLLSGICITLLLIAGPEGFTTGALKSTVAALCSYNFQISAI